MFSIFYTMIARTDLRPFICFVLLSIAHVVASCFPQNSRSRIFCEKAAAMHVYCLQWKDLAHRFLRHLHRFARAKGNRTCSTSNEKIDKTGDLTISPVQNREARWAFI
jgi:hypothetical protein